MCKPDLPSREAQPLKTEISAPSPTYPRRPVVMYMRSENFIRRTGIDGSRRELAGEFRRNPFGQHSPDLRCVLNFMRAGPTAGKHFLVTVRPQQEWMLGQMSESEPVVPLTFPEIRFRTLEEAEWYVFKIRWQRIFGTMLSDEFRND